jgi:hypothetical protein
VLIEHDLHATDTVLPAGIVGFLDQFDQERAVIVVREQLGEREELLVLVDVFDEVIEEREYVQCANTTGRHLGRR